MESPFNKIKYVFLIIILLPTVVFSIYEIGDYRENEKVIQTIYDNQLESILFSVNQYSEGVISSWANKINSMSNAGSSMTNQSFEQFSGETPSVVSLMQFNVNPSPVLYSGTDNKNDQLKNEIPEVIKKNAKVIDRLKIYLAEGYRKIESFKLREANLQLLVFLEKSGNKFVINALVVNSTQFIQEILDPKIQEIAQNKFYIGAFSQTDKKIFYNSDKLYTSNKFELKKPIWFFEGSFLTIELKNQTIKNLVQSRSRKNIYLITIIDLVLLFGTWIIFRNVRKQMELTKMKSDFIANISHEIRTPLALISMYVETLEMDRVNSESEKKEYFSIISQETNRLSNMVNQILDFSKTESNKQTYNFIETNLNTITEEIVNIFKLQLEARNFELQLDYCPSMPNILADKDAISNAIINLIDNAIKYSHADRDICISTFNNNEMVSIEVIDKGIGISENDQKKIFDRFFRVTRHNIANKTKGSGLGLTLVKYIVDAHKGRIEVKSKLGEGSSFKLEFPIKS